MRNQMRVGWGGLRVAPLIRGLRHCARTPFPQSSIKGSAMTNATTTVTKADTIRDLNDFFRRSFIGGVVLLTSGVEAMTVERRRSLLQKVRDFATFETDNDPHSEHDFGAIDEDDVRYFWKIDYYDRAMEAGSPDPADPSVTTRVLTIMQADEY
jgi:hypothetical protein